VGRHVLAGRLELDADDVSGQQAQVLVANRRAQDVLDQRFASSPVVGSGSSILAAMVTATCHCGAVAIDLAEARTEVTDCGCSVCRRRPVCGCMSH
jgi:hypothetical protein